MSISKSLPVVPDTTFTEREGVGYVGFIASQMDFVWREVSNTDLGIDGYLEIVVNGAPIGLIAVQVKSGPSYITYPNETRFSFPAKGKHIRYWLSCRLPVIIIVYDPDKKQAYWCHIQDYFNEHNELPSENPTVHFSKQALFDESSKEQLVRIASAPDSTAYAMLALRASRYTYTQELLTQMEMIELYGKRKWLGEWLPLDTEREEILIHSSLAMRGPAWFWFRDETERDYIPYLKNALKHPNSQLQSEAALALAAALQSETIEDLIVFLIQSRNVFGATEALASITNLTTDDKEKILSICWRLWDSYGPGWSREGSLKFLSLLAMIGGTKARQKIINEYLKVVPQRNANQSPIIRPPLLRNAGCLWDTDDLPELRQFVKVQESGLQDLAIVALAQRGEKQDCNLVMSYIESSNWNLGSEDISWLAKEAAHLFDITHLSRFTQLVRSSSPSLQALALRVLPVLCQSLDETTLLEMLTDANPVVQSCAAEGLVAIGKSDVLLEYETELLKTDYVSLIKNSAALTSTGDWTMIDKLLRSQNTSVLRGVAEGLQHVKGEKTFDCLLTLLQGEYDTWVHLDAANSLSIIGDEVALSKILEWLLEHSYERSTNLMASVLIYLDRKLYCPHQWQLKRERDFSILRYSVTRDDYC